MKGLPRPKRSAHLRIKASKCHDGMQSLINTLVLWKGKSMTILTVGIDLAKNVFAVNGALLHKASPLSW